MGSQPLSESGADVVTPVSAWKQTKRWLSSVGRLVRVSFHRNSLQLLLGYFLLPPMAAYFALVLVGQNHIAWRRLVFFTDSERFGAGVWLYFTVVAVGWIHIRAYKRWRSFRETQFDKDKRTFRPDIGPEELLWKAFRRREQQAESLKTQNLVYLLLGLLSACGVVVMWFLMQNIPINATTSTEKYASVFSRLLIISFAGSVPILFIKEHLSGLSDYKDFLELRMRADAQRAVFTLYTHRGEIGPERIDKLADQILRDSRMPDRPTGHGSTSWWGKRSDNLQVLEALAKTLEQVTTSALEIVNTAAKVKSGLTNTVFEPPVK